jgi:hypothetical protein
VGARWGTGAPQLLPDAFFIYQTKELELYAFVEVDLGSMGSKAFAQKVDRYLQLYRSGLWTETLALWPAVLTVVPTRTRLALLKRATEAALARVDQETREACEFWFSTFEDVEDPGPLAEIWDIAGKRGLQALFGSANQTGETVD